MIGIVVVSHSHALAAAAIGLSAEMVPADRAPTVLPAGGLDETTFGTDAAAIAGAIEQADSGDGVLVLLDLGSAILSAEMACEFIDPDVASRVRLSPAPLIEGLVAAVVTAATGAGLDACAREAERGLAAKTDHLAEPAHGGDEGVSAPSVGDRHVLAVTLDLPHGLHVRPAAAVVAALREVSAPVTARNATAGSDLVDARSLTGLAGLKLRSGDVLELVATGDDAARAVGGLATLVGQRFGEVDQAALAGGDHPQVSAEIVGPALVVDDAPELSAYSPGEDEGGRLRLAQVAVRDYLTARKEGPAEDLVMAWLALLDDRAFLPAGEKVITSGASAPEAVAVAVETAAQRFATLTDPYLRARAEDIRGLGRLLLRSLGGVDLEPSWPQEPFVAVLSELDLATCLSLDPDTCSGIVTWAGSDLGHGAIVARKRGIPYLAGAEWAADVVQGEVVECRVPAA